MTEKQINLSDRSDIILWLFTGCFLIFSMVVVGGITRLTGSGLSITKWDVVTGALPPMNQSEWETEFGHYMMTPQYEQINSHFTLEDFKGIYWWEYIHRLIGRLIGFVFIIPFLYFLFRFKLNGTLIRKCLLLFALGGLQGFLGWFMVKSGLVDMPSVSHFRLALHLCTAFITFSVTLWFALDLINTQKIESSGAFNKLIRLTRWTMILVFLQIIFGAFVAGLKAGKIYNTWPLMGESFIPEALPFTLNKDGIAAMVNDMAWVQFIHRYLAYMVVIAVVSLFVYARKISREGSVLLSGQMTAFYVVLAAVSLQFVLGIFTLLHAVPIVLGVIHQAGALLLLGAMVYLLHRLTHCSVTEESSFGVANS